MLISAKTHSRAEEDSGRRHTSNCKENWHKADQNRQDQEQNLRDGQHENWPVISGVIFQIAIN